MVVKVKKMYFIVYFAIALCAEYCRIDLIYNNFIKV